MTVEAALVREQAEHIHRNMPAGVVGGGVVASLMVGAFWDVTASIGGAIDGHARLSLWMAAIVLLSAWRLWQWLRFRQVQADEGHYRFHDEAQARDWLRAAVRGAAASGVIWGFGAAVFYQPDEFLYHLLFAYAIAMMGVTSLFGYSAHPPTFFAYFFPATVPAVIGMAAHGTLMHADVALGVSVFMAVSLKFFNSFHKQFVHSVELGFENRALVDALTVQKEAAESANLAKSRFLAAASHDLRQPMHALTLYMAAIDARALPPAARANLANARQCGQTMDEMFRALLDISRLDAGAVTAEVRAFALGPLLDRIRIEFTPQAQAKGLSLRVRPCHRVVRGDPELTLRVLRNLTDNAIRYTEHGRVLVGCRLQRAPKVACPPAPAAAQAGAARIPLSIAAALMTDRGAATGTVHALPVRDYHPGTLDRANPSHEERAREATQEAAPHGMPPAAPPDARLRIAVHDTGAGIAPEEQKQIFEEFYQVGNPERDRNKGIGLGLAIVDRLARLLGAPIVLRSSPGRGSMFGIDMPLAEGEEAARATEAAQAASTVIVYNVIGDRSGEVHGYGDTYGNDGDDALQGIPDVPAQIRGLFVLVVDDEETILAATRELLETWGCKVLTASSCAQAMRCLAESRAPDAIICDYRLREHETGIDVIDTLRGEFNTDIPALLVSGDSAPARMREAELNGLPVLHKPFNEQTLGLALEALLAASERSRTLAGAQSPPGEAMPGEADAPRPRGDGMAAREDGSMWDASTRAATMEAAAAQTGTTQIGAMKAGSPLAEEEAALRAAIRQVGEVTKAVKEDGEESGEEDGPRARDIADLRAAIFGNVQAQMRAQGKEIESADSAALPGPDEGVSVVVGREPLPRKD